MTRAGESSIVPSRAHFPTLPTAHNRFDTAAPYHRASLPTIKLVPVQTLIWASFRVEIR